MIGLGAAMSMASLAAPSQAADDQFTTVGASVAVKLCCSPGGAFGFGPAFNYDHYLREPSLGRFALAVGGYAWLHYYPSLHSARLGLGPQASSVFAGVEAGPSVLFGAEPANLTASVTPFVSGGYLWLGLRLNVVDPKGKDALLEFIAGAGYPFGAYETLSHLGN